MTRFKRGSEWRKWDLHLHPPGTKLNNCYGPDDLGSFCDALEASDVAVFGITDYFSFDGYLRVRDEFASRHPSSAKFLFANLELRITEAINKDDHLVNVHLLFPPSVSDAKLKRFLDSLHLQSTDDRGLKRRCADLETPADFNKACVIREDIFHALDETFGKDWGPDDVILAVPAGNDGIRSASGNQRKAEIEREMAWAADVIFGGRKDVDWYLKADRYGETAKHYRPLPVFACSDAHDMKQLDERLGKSVSSAGDQRDITWVKADPTYEGLLQTLVEPSERVRIRAIRPDEKAPFKRIDRVQFTGSTDFSEDAIELNGNLVSVIGSRSSGKSALLAYISHAIDPEYTVRQQIRSGLAESEATAGPAAARTWDMVKHIKCTVTWGSPEVSEGKVVYIPQNSLFNISEQPEEITEKILPTLYRLDPDFQVAHDRMKAAVERANTGIVESVGAWFRLDAQVAEARRKVRELGDPAAIRATCNDIEDQIRRLRDESELSAEDISAYQEIIRSLAEHSERLAEIEEEVRLIAPLVDVGVGPGSYRATGEVKVHVQVLPDVAVPQNLRLLLDPQVAEAEHELLGEVRAEVERYRAGLDVARADVESLAAALRENNAELIARNEANVEIDRLVAQLGEHESLLNRIIAGKADVERFVIEQQVALSHVANHISTRKSAIDELIATFESKSRVLEGEGMDFSVETDYSEERISAASIRVDRRERSVWLDGDTRQLTVEAIHQNAEAFLADLVTGRQRLKQGVAPVEVATTVLLLTPQVEFVASMEGDRIGGFGPSSMTPGKQALFALTLIINESEDEWPLLLDQPEDDLDSRSIFTSIVPFLMKRKRKRQIIMVSHDANLVIGADSEQVIVANRHGDDRKNRDDRTFDYLTGSLEWTRPFDRNARFVLDSAGTREHACEILDGGEEAFRKRRQKYKI